MIHFHQTKAFQDFQESLGNKTFRRSGDNWEYLAILEHGKGNSRLFSPYGPSATNDQAFQQAIADLIELGKEQKATFLRVEPLELSQAEWLKNEGWHKTTYQKLNPQHTRIIDLTQPEDQLISNMAQPVRNIFRNYHKKGLTVTQSTNPDEVDIFLDFIHQVAARTGLRPHSDDYIRQQAKSLFPIGAAKLWIARLSEQPIATIITFDDGTTRYYAHAAASSDPQYRKLNAGTALLAEAIVEAKRQGLSRFDLYGVTPDGDSRNQAWAGFTKFKQSFSGQDLSYGGTWEKPLQPIGYAIYRLYHSLRKIVP